MPTSRSILLGTPLLAASLCLSAAPAYAQEVAQNGPPPGAVLVAPGQPPPTVIIQQQYPQPVYQPPQYPQGQVYYAQPGQPQYVQAPPPAAPQGPRIIKNWDESQPIPPGYHTETHVRTGLIVGGAVLFGTTYLLSALIGSIGSDIGSSSLNGLYVPGIGPFIAMPAAGDATGGLFLALDGLCQLGGIAMFTAGFVAPRTQLVRNDIGLNWHVMPVFNRDHQGMALVGTF